MPGDGLMWKEMCYRDRTELAQMACSSMNGATNGQYVFKCSNPSVTGTTLTVQAQWLNNGGGLSPVAQSFALSPCEPYDFQWWAPVLGAFFLALVTIASARMVYTKVFNRETY